MSWTPKYGDEVIWFYDLADPSSMRQGAVSKVAGGLAWIGEHHKAEDCIYIANLWPKRVENEITSIVAKRQELKKAYNDSITLVYALRNSITRGEK